MTAAKAAKQIGKELGRSDAKGAARLAVDLSKSKHTPGPWCADTGDYPVIVNGPDANTRIICIIEDPDSPTAATAKTQAENDANARLIAAAPDLLEACKATEAAAKAACAASDACADGSQIPAHVASSVDALYIKAERLRAVAIAKATGK